MKRIKAKGGEKKQLPFLGTKRVFATHKNSLER